MVSFKNRIKLSLSSWSSNLITTFTVYMTILILAVVLFGCINFFSPGNRKIVFFLSLIILAVIFLACFVFFIKKVYSPIMTYENAIKILESGDLENFLNYNTKHLNYPNTENMRNILIRLRYAVNRQYSAEILKRQAEFSALQSQINPHFLYNTLEAIRGQALIEGVEDIAEMTEALSTFFRYSISKKGDLVSLEDELSSVESYFVIQQFRFNNKFGFSIKYDETDSDILDYMLPKLTLQPIVENSIYHGLETKVGKGSITIRITSTEKRLIINISDDGEGMDKATQDNLNYKLHNGLDQPDTQEQQGKPRHTGIALVNVNMRIKLLFGEEYGMSVSSTKGLGTEVEIVLPHVKEENIQNIHNLRVNYES